MIKKRFKWSKNAQQVTKEIDGYIIIVDYCKEDGEIIFVKADYFENGVSMGHIRYDYGDVQVNVNSEIVTLTEIFNSIKKGL
ncbi:MAG: hypothetical protein ACRC3Z_11240 [Phocaeicola sp.]